MTQKPHPISLRAQPTEPQIHFERAAFAMVMAAANGQDEDFACRIFPDDAVLPILLRAAQSPGSTGGWASTLALQTTGAFLRSLSPQSAAAALMDRGIEVDFGRFEQVTMPGRAETPSRLPWVAEGQPIPVSKETVTGTQIGPARKMGVIVVFSSTLAKRSSAQSTFIALLRESTAASLDAAYFSADAGDDVTHAGLLYGVSPTTTASGNVKDDLASLAGAVSVGGSGQVVFIMGPARAAKLPILVPELRSVVLPSSAVPENRVIAIDPLSLIHGAGTEPDISASNAALLHMSDDPNAIVASGSTADPVRSLYQTDAIALSCLIDVTFAKRRPGAVAFMDIVEPYEWAT